MPLTLFDVETGTGNVAVKEALNDNFTLLQAHLDETDNAHGAEESIDVLTINTTFTAPAVTRPVTLWPEYPGIVWYNYEGNAGGYFPIDGGRLEALYEGSGGKNYYEWRGPSGGTQVELQGALKFTLPGNFSAWDTNNAIQLSIWTTDATGASEMDIATYRNTTAGGTKVDQISSAAWSYVNFTAAQLAASPWSAGDVLTLELALRAQVSGSSKVIRLGDIILKFSTTY